MSVMRNTAGRGLFAMCLVSTAAAAALVPAVAGAQEGFPERPIEITVSYGPGGSSDLAARTFAEAAERHLDGNIVVQNRAGAGGVVGSQHVYSAEPNGYKLLLGRVATLAVGPALRDVPYDPDGFTYVGLLSTDPFACVTGPDKPYSDLAGLKEAIEASPGSVTYNSSGIGSLNQFAALRLLEAMGFDNPAAAATHVPDEGEGPALSAVAGGHIDFFCGNLAPMLQQIQSGQVQPLLVTSEERNEDLPDVPTVSELGHPGLENLVGWSALVGPPNMNDEAHTVLVELMQEVKTDERWQEKVRELGSIPNIRSPQASREFAREQRQGFEDLVERLDL
ncbi:Bug family tripartite tricarboxylate transporter substrate binding protein [Spiribacter halobius]|uniref:Tripartite tricarboxylate transporter substrate binding protein n=1 Tax=Sediminicurvatus halobius TaxID=2182432 RepID=A0A2U2N8N3_9GAMM|nr:tripartite tricarboxylate transporter substrate binding protein [Spiribacter halobius]PWG65546.1 hypothetical protein DEM34_02060 [Spiribacter halobius]UEX76572.1 tripartite tricarboxylate transporter substrate binding protein [Spiribacter halobius]